MLQRFRFTWTLFWVVLLLANQLTGCATLPTSATPDMSIPLTHAAQTLEIRETLQTGQTAVAQLTRLAASPTPSPLPPEATATPFPTNTPIPPSPTLPAAPCYLAEILAEINAPQNSLLPNGAAFVKTWNIKNAGTCPWSPQFSLVLAGGDPMGLAASYPLGSQVAPGENVNLSIALTAPGFPGAHQGNWFLRSPDGETFGVGPNASTPFQVIIRTTQSGVYTANTNDLSLSMCAAEWISGAGRLGCPGMAGDPKGSITLLEQPALESRRDSGTALLTRPDLAVNGWIRGQFPAYYVRNYDHFFTEIGCLSGSPNCQLNFRVDYQAADGSKGNLGKWRETFDGRTTLVDLDLSGLAGKTIQIILQVENVGNANNANAFWLQPRIQNQALNNIQVLSWTREGLPGFPCAELKVYLNPLGQGEAQAFSCGPAHNELGRTSLSGQEIKQLFDWTQRFKFFNAEISRASTNTPVVTRISFKGSGIFDAADPDLQAINTFAAALFNRIILK